MLLQPMQRMLPPTAGGPGRTEADSHLESIRPTNHRRSSMALSFEAGQPAADFTLPNQNGRSVNLSDYRGHWVVLFFYPKDNTKG
jgi:hypothetical protein